MQGRINGAGYGGISMDDISLVLSVAERFGGKAIKAERFGSGHINDTYKVTTETCGKDLILQKINTSVFTQPLLVMQNISLVTEFLSKKIREAGGDPSRETLEILKEKNGRNYFIDDCGGFWRCFNYIGNTVSYESIENSAQMYVLGKAFGKFQRLLKDFPADRLSETITNFHNTPSRLRDFKAAVENNLSGRAQSVQMEIEFALSRESEAGTVQDLIDGGEIPLRVTHNDTKLNNVLIDADTKKAVCVIDLDTVMPGSALFDFGDGVRSGANSGAEDETDLSLVSLNDDYYINFAKGFLSETKGFLTVNEVKLLAFSPRLIALELGMRFLGDHLNGDTYFRIGRPNHNLDRARTQFKMLEDMENKKDFMESVIAEAVR
jgi:hypothetical protein